MPPRVTAGVTAGVMAVGSESRPGQGPRPGIEDQNTSTGLGKPAQVPRDPAGPNAEPFDPDAEDLRPRVGEGAGDPRAGAGSLEDEEGGSTSSGT